MKKADTTMTAEPVNSAEAVCADTALLVAIVAAGPLALRKYPSIR